MPTNVYDQASRFAAKLDPAGFLCWLLKLQPGDIVFRRWLDTHLIPFPGEPDRTCDTVAFLEAVRHGHIPWALVSEFQIAPDPLMFGRLLAYLGQIWLELKPSDERGDRFWLGAVVVNLTGRGNTSRTMAWDEAGLRTGLTVREVNLCDVDAGQTLDEIAAGLTTAVLPFIPLMQNGGDPGIIQRWLALASAEPDSRRRSEYGALALLFSEPAGCRPAWENALRGWNMIQSQTVTEWMSKGKVDILLRVVRGRFGSLPAEVESAIRAATDPAVLDQWADAAAVSPTLDDFRRATGL